MALTDTWLKANNGKERAALDERSDRDGLGVRVTPNGKIAFQLRYRYAGTPKRLDLGTYPLLLSAFMRDQRTDQRVRDRGGDDRLPSLVGLHDDERTGGREVPDVLATYRMKVLPPD